LGKNEVAESLARVAELPLPLQPRSPRGVQVPVLPGGEVVEPDAGIAHPLTRARVPLVEVSRGLPAAPPDLTQDLKRLRALRTHTANVTPAGPPKRPKIKQSLNPLIVSQSLPSRTFTAGVHALAGWLPVALQIAAVR